MYSCTLKAGLVDVVLPNGMRYQGGDVVILSAQHYGQMPVATRAAVFSAQTVVIVPAT
jgi:hypothetical protein